MPRYTVKALRAEVERVNKWLAEIGCTTRLEEHGRNGYQAIDEYSVDTDGNRIGSGVNFNVKCGTARECISAALTYYALKYAERNRFAFDESKVSYEIIVEPESIDVRGNAIASGDDEYDRKIENEIFGRLADGDVWAWADVKVIARYEGIDNVEGVDHLGCCSYKDQDDFEQSGYYEDMKTAARDDLHEQLETIVDKLTG